MNGNTLAFSVRGSMRTGLLSLFADAAVSTTSLEISRSISLNTVSRTEAGKTRSLASGAGFDMEYNLSRNQDVHLAAFGGVSFFKQEVRGFSETGDRSTALIFESFRRDSFSAHIGYKFEYLQPLKAYEVMPFGSVAYEMQLKDRPVKVTARSKAMPGRFQMQGVVPASHALHLRAGVKMHVSDAMTAFVDYNGRIAGNSDRSHAVNLSLVSAF